MENSNSLDVRNVFLNRVLFGTKIAPELKNGSYTSDEFTKLLQMDYTNEKEAVFYEISINYLNQLTEIDRAAFVSIIAINKKYNMLLFLIYKMTKKVKDQTEDSIKARIYEDLMSFKNEGLANDSVMYYFKVMLDRLTLFNFQIPGKISREEYLKISSQLLFNDLENIF